MTGFFETIDWAVRHPLITLVALSLVGLQALMLVLSARGR